MVFKESLGPFIERIVCLRPALHPPIVRRVAELDNCIGTHFRYGILGRIEHPLLEMDIGNDKDKHGDLRSRMRAFPRV